MRSFHFPPEPNGFYGYNALQQLAYFAAIFFSRRSRFLRRAMSAAPGNGESLFMVLPPVWWKTGDPTPSTF